MRQINESGVANALEKEEPGDGYGLLVSLKHTGNVATVRITGVSLAPDGYIIWLDQHRLKVIHKFTEGDTEASFIRGVRDEFVTKIPDGYKVFKVGETAFRLESNLPSERQKINYLSISVFNVDSKIEVLELRRMTLKTTNNILVKNNGARIVLDNENPYIINVPRQWQHRPGLDSNRSESSVSALGIRYESPSDSLFRRWIPAGTYMATYTRLTTMEAANESGRHAVNAILRKLSEPAPSGSLAYNGQGKLFGDFCQIWDPEDYEPPDLQTSKDLDMALVREGLPHVFDILRIIDIIENLPEDISVRDALMQIRRSVENQWSIATASLVGLSALDSAIRAQVQVLNSLLSGVLR